MPTAETDATAALRPLPPAATRAFGLVAALAYTTVVIVGGLITPGYSHTAQPVSSLYQAGSVNGTAIALAFFGYNLFVIAFGFVMGGYAHALGGRRSRAGIAAGIGLILTGIAGACDDLFPQDPIGAPVTTSGGLHIAFAALASLATLVTVALAVSWLLARMDRRRFALYSAASFGLILISGPITAAQTAASSPQMGLWERLTIFTFIVWMGAFSAVLTFGRAPRDR